MVFETFTRVLARLKLHYNALEASLLHSNDVFEMHYNAIVNDQSLKYCMNLKRYHS